MAQQLIDSLSTELEPEKYRDEYREKVLELIERKAAGEEIAVQPEAPQPTKVPDLWPRSRPAWPRSRAPPTAARSASPQEAQAAAPSSERAARRPARADGRSATRSAARPQEA